MWRWLLWLALLAVPVACAAPPAPQANATPGQGVAGKAYLPPPRAADLLDADPTEVLRALGPPDLRRPEGSAEVWLYDAPDRCRLDVVFYGLPGGPPGERRVAHVAIRLVPPQPPGDEAACLAAIAGP